MVLVLRGVADDQAEAVVEGIKEEWENCRAEGKPLVLVIEPSVEIAAVKGGLQSIYVVRPHREPVEIHIEIGQEIVTQRAVRPEVCGT